MKPGKLAITANRWEPFDDTIDFVGYDFTGATFTLQVRLYPDATGDPLINLANADPPAAGLSVTVATTEGVPTSTLRIIIAEATIEGLFPTGSGQEAGADVKLAWALHITPSGGTKRRWLEGDFIIHAGANQA